MYLEIFKYTNTVDQKVAQNKQLTPENKEKVVLHNDNLQFLAVQHDISWFSSRSYT